MRAIILAAGKGERLKNITQKIPKPMIDFQGKPILQHNIELCKRNGITDIYINTHYLANKVLEYFGNGEKFGVNINYSYESELMGTAGAVKKIANEFWNNGLKPTDSFFVIYGDNYSEYNLKLLIEKQKETNSDCIIAFHYREDVTQSGVAEFNKKGKIKTFIEKPKLDDTDSHWVNAGIYLLNSNILNFIPCGFSDFAKDIFPILLKKNIPLYGILNKTDVCAFDTPEMYFNSLNKISNVKK